jgi:hypothetical protein
MSAYIAVALQAKVREKFGNCCAYCQTAEALTAMTFEFEHRYPLALGGKTVFENLCFACPSCNRAKGERVKVVDPDSGQQVPMFHPHQQVWLEHFGWNTDGTIMIGKTATGRGTIEALHMNRASLVRMREMWVMFGEHPPIWSLD